MKSDVPVSDVLIAGAGPAGTALALRLARAGARVTLVERARFPRRKVCGEYLASGAVAALDELGVRAEIEPHAVRLRGVRIFAAGAPDISLEFARPAWSLTREQLDALLLDAACAAGATVVHGRVEDVLRSDGRARGFVVRDERGATADLHGRILVGADGVGSIVARKLGLTVLRHGGRYAVGGHYRGLGDLDGYVEMYVAAGAYFAVNPLSSELANMMLVVRKSVLAAWSGAIDRGIAVKAAELARGRRALDCAERVGARVSIGPLEHRVRRRAARGVLLVGDAAGFVNPFTGQGVDLALRSSAAAARAVLASLAKPENEAVAFAEYDRALGRELAARRRLAAIVDAIVDVPFLARRAAARLARFPRAAETMLDALGGGAPAASALRPAVLGRLLV